MRLTCEACDRFDHDGCKRSVRAFIEPSGPESYVCECHCNQRRMRKATADRKVTELVVAYRREFGQEALDMVLDMPREGVRG